MILCTMPGCDTTSGCQCRRGYREVNHFWQDKHGQPTEHALTAEALRKAFAKGFEAGRAFQNSKHLNFKADDLDQAWSGSRAALEVRSDG